MDVGLYVGVAIVRPRGSLLGFVESWRGDHTVSLSGGVTVFRTWCGLLRFMEGGRVDHDVGLLGAVGGEMCRCGLCGVVCGEIMTSGRWKAYRFPRLQATGGWEWRFSGGWHWMVVSFCVWVAEIDAGRMASQIVKGVESPSEVNIGQVEVGVVVVDMPLKCWW